MRWPELRWNAAFVGNHATNWGGRGRKKWGWRGEVRGGWEELKKPIDEEAKAYIFKS
jgi:hypothetical protein